MMKIMMKYNSIKEVRGAPNDTQHQNAHPQKFFRLW